jgi:hypothetical protein
MFKSTVIAAGFAFALSGAAFAQQQNGLVNVNISDVVDDIAVAINVDRNQIPVTVQVPVGIAANVCNVSAAVLAQQAADAAPCDATTTSQALNQAVQRNVGGGGQKQKQGSGG